MDEAIRVLIVSPQATLREQIQASLHEVLDERARFIGAESVARALNLGRANRPHLVACDLADVMEDKLSMRRLAQLPKAVTVGIYQPQTLRANQTESECILQAIRAGFQDVLRFPLSRQEVSEVLDRVLLSGRLPEARASKGQIFGIFGCKGGVGRTTVAVNLATLLAAGLDDEVCLVDTTRQYGNARNYLGFDPKSGLLEAVQAEDRLDSELIRSLMVRDERSGLWFLDAPLRIDAPLDQHGLARVLLTLQDMYSVVICDGEIGVDAYTLTLLDLCNRVCLLLEAVVPTIRATRHLLGVLQDLEYAAEKFLVVLNRYNDFEGNVDFEEVGQALGHAVEALCPYERRCLIAINEGVPLVLSEPKTRFSVALRELAQVLIGDAEIQPIKKRSGLLSRLFGG